MWARHGLIAGTCWVWLACHAEAADLKDLIRAASDRAAKASTAADYDAILDLCRQAQEAGATGSQTEYLRSLASWAHNRRGEMYTEQASELLERGEVQQAATLDGKALAEFELAIKLDGTRWKAWHNRGVSYAIAGKYEQAVADFTRVIELSPGYANAWFNRGEIRFDMGKVDEALQDYAEAIRLNPKDAGAYTSRGHAYFRLGKFAEALNDYSQAIELSPDDATALANRGDAYQSLGQWQQAADDLNRAVQRDPNSPRALQSAAWLMATCPDQQLRNEKYAVQAAERALELAGQPDVRYLDTLAAALANANRFQEAVAKVQEALRLATPEEAPSLQRRLALYRQQQPYRQGGTHSSAQAAPRAKSGTARK